MKRQMNDYINWRFQNYRNLELEGAFKAIKSKTILSVGINLLLLLLLLPYNSQM